MYTFLSSISVEMQLWWSHTFVIYRYDNAIAVYLSTMHSAMNNTHIELSKPYTNAELTQTHYNMGIHLGSITHLQLLYSNAMS